MWLGWERQGVHTVLVGKALGKKIHLQDWAEDRRITLRWILRKKLLWSEADGTGSELCPVSAFGISSAEPSGSANTRCVACQRVWRIFKLWIHYENFAVLISVCEIIEGKYTLEVPFSWTSGLNPTNSYVSCEFVYQSCELQIANFLLDRNSTTKWKPWKPHN
jgi:hypothetical protein